MNQRLTFHPTFLDYPQRLSNGSFFSFVVRCIDAKPGGGGRVEALSSEEFVYLFVFVTLHIGIFQTCLQRRVQSDAAFSKPTLCMPRISPKASLSQ